jgi:hypothetical protein
MKRFFAMLDWSFIYQCKLLSTVKQAMQKKSVTTYLSVQTAWLVHCKEFLSSMAVKREVCNS